MALPINYADVVMLFLFLFAAIGLLRGWHKEGVTSFFAAGLAVLVWKPSQARKIIDVANELIKLMAGFLKSGLSYQPDQIMAQNVDPDLLLDPDSYRLYIVVMVVLLIVSYLVGEVTFKQRITPLGRLLGGFLGAFNGYVILALIKQYLLNDLQAQGKLVAQSDELAVQLTGVPTSNFFAGSGIVFIFVVVIGIVALLVAGDKLRLPLK
jgi:hypothetical protein